MVCHHGKATLFFDSEHRQQDGTLHVPRFHTRKAITQGSSTEHSSTTCNSATVPSPVGKQVSDRETLRKGQHTNEIDLSQHINLGSNSCYMLVGSIGSFIAPIAIWLVQHGAKNTIVISDETLDSELICQGEAEGCRISWTTRDAAGLSSRSSIRVAIDKAAMPGLKGVFFFPSRSQVIMEQLS